MNEFKKVLEELTDVFRVLTAIAQVKLGAATTNRVATIEECMTKEQPLIMKLRGLENRRIEIQEKLGYKDLSFSQILEQSDENLRAELVVYFDALSRQIQMFELVNNDVVSAINVNLRQFQKSIEQATENAPKSTSSITNKSV